MIISVSRRTDIPAFFSEWFFNRIKEGYVLVRNPMNYHQISRIKLDCSVVDCIVFWTKNPKNMLSKLDELNRYKYYFQFTLNPYDKTIEKNLPSKTEVIKTFIELSEKIGKNKVIWRYDPIILSDKFDKEYHYRHFDYLANCLKNYTNKCIISFLDLYKKTEFNLKYINLMPMSITDMLEIGREFSKIANKYGLILETCSESVDLFKYGIKHGKCIDGKLISDIIGINIDIEKDPNQRENCGCVKSIDIGTYNTCNNNCLYCYANFNSKLAQNNIKKHNPKSPLILGQIEEEDLIKEKEMKSYIKNMHQQSIWDII